MDGNDADALVLAGYRAAWRTGQARRRGVRGHDGGSVRLGHGREEEDDLTRGPALSALQREREGGTRSSAREKRAAALPRAGLAILGRPVVPRRRREEGAGGLLARWAGERGAGRVGQIQTEREFPFFFLFFKFLNLFFK